ncbi:hypothetical protein [Arsenicibacter rosenii]|uniref:hypothetical protein n=1 Tax=Arsenicibacter rosenii TaxID=1750698 RepID=UPI001160C642|nr:hypothetical protein [Arsenicibacter rosenii]
MINSSVNVQFFRLTIASRRGKPTRWQTRQIDHYQCLRASVTYKPMHHHYPRTTVVLTAALGHAGYQPACAHPEQL